MLHRENGEVAVGAGGRADMHQIELFLREQFGGVGVAAGNGEFLDKSLQAHGIKINCRNDLYAIDERLQPLHVSGRDAAGADDRDAVMCRHGVGV